MAIIFFISVTYFSLNFQSQKLIPLPTSILHVDQDLLSGLRLGEEESFLKIYNQFWPKLYVIALNRLNSRQAAEDVVQEVMTTLWQRRQEVQINNLEAWLSAATRYSVFRQLAKYGAQTIVPITQQKEASYEQPFDLGFLDRMLKDRIHSLPEKCRLVFNYSRQEGLSNKEIARHLDISEKAVEKHITKAIRNLRLSLKESIPSLITGLLSVFFF